MNVEHRTFNIQRRMEEKRNTEEYFEQKIAKEAKKKTEEMNVERSIRRRRTYGGNGREEKQKTEESPDFTSGAR